MKIIKYFVAIAAATILVGCYEDKGNYDYKELYEPTVDYTSPISFLIGDTLKNKLEIEPVAPRTIDDYKVEWFVKGEKVAEGLELSIPNFVTSSGYSSANYMIVEDKISGIQFRYDFSIDATALYESGWVILSEENGETHLHFVRGSRIIDDDDNVTDTEFTLYKDAYTGLPSGPKKLVEHWATSGYGSEPGEIAVICENNNVVELNSDLQYVLSLQDEFIDNTFPADLNVDNAVYMMNNSFVYTKDGAMYSRNNADPEGYHTGRYLNVPVYPSGGMQVGFTVPTAFTSTYQALVYDSQNHRYLLLNDDPYRENNIALITAYSGGEDTVAGNILLNDMGSDRRAIACGSYLSGSYSRSNYYSILKDESTGKYYMHDFGAEITYSGTGTIEDYTQAELSWGAGKLSDETMIAVLPDNQNRVFFATGNTLYFNSKNADDPTLFKTFPAKITAIDFDICEYSMWVYENNQLCVALENGEFYIFDISYEAMRNIINGGTPTELFKTNGLGTIVNAIYKMGINPGYMRY